MEKKRTAAFWNSLCALLMLLSTAAGAQTGMRPMPPSLHAVSDEIGALSVEQGRDLARQTGAIEEKTGVKIIIVIAATTHPETIEQYTQRLIDYWKARSNALDRGSFIFVVMAPSDRALRIVPAANLAFIHSELSEQGIMAGVADMLRRQDHYLALLTIMERLAKLIVERRGQREMGNV